MHNNDKFAKRVRMLMLRSDYTIHKLASAMAVADTTVQNWRCGAVPSVKHLILLASTLRCSVDFLLEGTGVETGLYSSKSDGGQRIADDLFNTQELWVSTGKALEMVRVPNSGVEKAKKELTERYTSRNVQSMQYTLSDLLNDVRHLTKSRGAQAKLAAAMSVPTSRVSEWLKGKTKPTAEVTLKLLNWVQEQKRK